LVMPNTEQKERAQLTEEVRGYIRFKHGKSTKGSTKGRKKGKKKCHSKEVQNQWRKKGDSQKREGKGEKERIPWAFSNRKLHVL